MRHSKSIILWLCIAIVSSYGCVNDSSTNRPGGNPSFDLCINIDKDNVTVDETVSVTNCGMTLPEERVAPIIDWGDGAQTEGQSGTHTYSSTGTYTVELMLSGGHTLTDFVEDDSQIKKQVTVE